MTDQFAEKISMLSPNDIALVRASFAWVVPIQDTAADLFYDRLFAVAPKLRKLFPADLCEQKRKLVQMIATAVGGLNNLDKLVPAVKETRGAPFRLWRGGGALSDRRRSAAMDA
jgi:hemoglobin-like flavoprotein